MEVKDVYINIKIYYLLLDNYEWQILQMKPEEYFDLDEDEQAETDSVPKFNHALDYFKDDTSKITRTKIEIFDRETKKQRIISTSYWNNQRNSIAQRIDSGVDFYKSEIILQTNIQDQPPVYEILRVKMENDIIIPIYHGFITDNPDGSQSEQRTL